MMREIKFRAWDKKDMKMVFDESWSWFSDVYMPEVDGINHFLMQFTGLTDKNGKEIYEGDIVISTLKHDYRWLIEYRADHEFVGFLPVEKGRFDRFLSKFVPKDDETLSFFVAWPNLIVIGNIYENPDLLKS